MTSLAPRIGFRMVFGIEIVLIEQSQGAEACATTDSPEEDIGRLDTLGRIFGIGLILFNAKNAKDPKFEISVRAVKHEPDMFYVTRRTGSRNCCPTNGPPPGPPRIPNPGRQSQTCTLTPESDLGSPAGYCQRRSGLCQQ